MRVSWNGGTPQSSSISRWGYSLRNQPLWVPPFMETPRWWQTNWLHSASLGNADNSSLATCLSFVHPMILVLRAFGFRCVWFSCPEFRMIHHDSPELTRIIFWMCVSTSHRFQVGERSEFAWNIQHIAVEHQKWWPSQPKILNRGISHAGGDGGAGEATVQEKLKLEAEAELWDIVYHVSTLYTHVCILYIYNYICFNAPGNK